jgi:hypothetical protein
MSEEKPTFKITDRRLFNPDGSPRDIEREEEAPAPAQAATEMPPMPATETAAPPPAASPAAATVQAAGAPAQPLAGEGVGAGATQPAADAGDSQEFLMVVEFIASFAAEALGMSAHPESGGQAHVNPQLARQCIDMLGALERKTRGNLNAEEQQFLDLVLTQLRMQYVQLTRPRTAGRGQPGGGPPRGGFTGGDITGGR